MKILNLILSFAAVGGMLLAYLHYSLISSPNNSMKENSERDTLMKIIQLQNETLSLMMKNMRSQTNPTIKQLSDILQEKEKEISSLTKIAEELDIQKNVVVSSPSTQLSSCHLETSLVPAMSKPESECERRYGLQLISLWRRSEEVWCENPPKHKPEDSIKHPTSQLKCYPYVQEHKKKSHGGVDMFCVATNFFIDFSKITGGQTGIRTKPPRGSQYLDFQSGSLFASCSKTASYNERKFMPHHARQMSGFQSDKLPPHSSYDTIDTPTYLLARDEDCENSFHSTADFMNMFVALSIARVSPKNVQVMLFDKFPDGPYIELIKRAYSPSHEVIRPSHYSHKTVLFRQLIFHLESPAGLIFPKVAAPDPMRCRSSTLFEGYRKFVLEAFNLWDVPPPPIPQVILSLRHRTPEVVDTSTMSYGDQLRMVRSSNVVVGLHGAGLMLIMFAAEEAVLVEIHPSYRQDRHFRHAARLTGKIYLPMRATRRETCVGSSDTIEVPLDEFRRTMDGALRLARSFDDGLSECGLSCPLNILAIDSRLDSHYESVKMRKGSSLELRFPC